MAPKKGAKKGAYKKRGAPRRGKKAFVPRTVVAKVSNLISGTIMNRQKVKKDYMSKTIQFAYLGTNAAVDNTTIPTTTSAGVAPAYQTWPRFNWINAAELAALQSLYTHYKILGVDYTFTLNSENFGTIVPNASYIPKLLCRYNYDASIEGTAPTVASFQELSNYRVYNFTGEQNMVKYSFYPRILKTVNQSTVSVTSNAPGKPYWFDLDFPTVPHMGIQFLMPALPTASTLLVEATIRFAVKNTK